MILLVCKVGNFFRISLLPPLTFLTRWHASLHCEVRTLRWCHRASAVLLLWTDVQVGTRAGSLSNPLRLIVKATTCAVTGEKVGESFVKRSRKWKPKVAGRSFSLHFYFTTGRCVTCVPSQPPLQISSLTPRGLFWAVSSSCWNWNFKLLSRLGLTTTTTSQKYLQTSTFWAYMNKQWSQQTSSGFSASW